MADQYWSGWRPKLFYDFKLAPQEWIDTVRQITITTQFISQRVWMDCVCGVGEGDVDTWKKSFQVWDGANVRKPWVYRKKPLWAAWRMYYSFGFLSNLNIFGLSQSKFWLKYVKSSVSNYCLGLTWLSWSAVTYSFFFKSWLIEKKMNCLTVQVPH